jgi:spermidine synthase
MPPSAASPRVPRGGSAPFVLAIFAGAFLIFQVQPMVGKHILPWFGGAPGVWSLCLAFYQTALFLGYAYAHWLIRHIPPARQPLVHALLLLAALAVLPVLPEADWKPAGDDSPGLRILAMLSANVGPPFLLLAATGPLVQAWFARAFPARSPYPLYALSNAGSLLALLSYPVVIEPSLALSTQSRVWSGAFSVCGLVILYCAWLAARSARDADALEPPDGTGAIPPAPGLATPLLWAALPGCAVVLLMGITNELCLNLASVPFLWIIPLSVYLLTFILCFASARFYRRGPFALLAAAALSLLLQAQGWTLTPDSDVSADVPVLRHIARYSLLLFACCSLLHGELYRLRPPAQRLTAYYLCIAGGGALGGLFVGVAAPALFSDYHELGLGIAACWTLLAVCVWRDSSSVLCGGRPRAVWALLVALGLACVAALSLPERHPNAELLAQRRNFFGVLHVVERNRGHSMRHYRMLNSGTTTHGVQYQEAALRARPVSYFGHATGAGFTMRQRQPGERTRVGVIGLGIGALSAYGREGDRFRFYEIDPDVASIARDEGYFSYLADSRARVEVVLGDARLSLEAELREAGSQGFDLLVLDAFTSDAIPVHLLTTQAFALYDRHLADGGIILVHVSNRHLDLSPLLFGHAAHLGMRAVEILNEPVRSQRSTNSRWVVLTRDAAYVDELLDFVRAQHKALQLPRGVVGVRRPDARRVGNYPVWTDDFSNLFGLLSSSDAR